MGPVIIRITAFERRLHFKKHNFSNINFNNKNYLIQIIYWK